MLKPDAVRRRYERASEENFTQPIKNPIHALLPPSVRTLLSTKSAHLTNEAEVIPSLPVHDRHFQVAAQTLSARAAARALPRASAARRRLRA